jgi:hypothetical protein
MKRLITHLVFLFIFSEVVGQVAETDFQAELENIVESAFAEDESADVEQLIDELQLLRERPFNINQATRDDFMRLYFLSPIQIENLLNYREQYGQIYSAFELNSVEGFDPQLIKVLQNFVIFGETASRAARKFSDHEVLFRTIRLLEKQKGFREPAKYEGTQEKLYLRYRYSSENIQAGLTSEKDAGESFFSGANANGFDFYSGFVNVGFAKGKHRLYAGDYLVQLGQGLVAWQGFSLSKSTEVENVAKFNQGIRSYSSTDENKFMRGVATDFSLGRFKWYSFLSYKNFDANRDSIDGQAVFTSFQTSGLHRTAGEIEDKNSVSGLTAGSGLKYSAGQFSLGLSAVHQQFELPLKKADADYNRFLFEGGQLTNLGADYQWGMNRYYFFGETAWSGTNGWATLHGLQATPVDQLGFSILYRNIGKKYNAPLAGAFTEGSQVNDEQGVYLGAVLRPAAKINIRMYADFFQHRWIKYTTAAPASGHEYLAQLDYQLPQGWKVYGRYFYERKPVKANGELTKINLAQKREKLRLQLDGKWKETLLFKSRAEWIWYGHEQLSQGFLIFQDVGFKTRKNNLNCWARIAYFNTDDYDSRVYAYENDLLYQFSIPAFYGEGFRFYLNGKVKICENIDIWVKASQSKYLAADLIGSGNSEIEGNKRTEVKFQVRYRF